MNQQNQDTTNSPPPASANDVLAKRRRGRPRKDENSTHMTPKSDIDLVGKVVSGVVEGSFDAGYILNVKVKDSDTKLRGLVFLPGRVNPITPDNDVAPRVKMYGREGIRKIQTDQSLPSDQPMEEAAVITDLEISETARALSLMSQQVSNGESAVQVKEAMVEKDGVMVQAKEAMMEKDGAIEEATTRLVDFFPAPEAMITTVQPNLALARKETEQQKSSGENRGFDFMAEETVCPGERVQEKLQLMLGNQTTLSGDVKNSIATTETDPISSVSKSGFIANLFEGENKKVNMEEEANPSMQ